MKHIDYHFLMLISTRMDNFKQVSNDLYRMRCPICGDSKKKKDKARGYVYAIDEGYNYKCHNCDASMSLCSLIAHVDPALKDEYILARFKERNPIKNKEDVFEKITYRIPEKTLFQHLIPLQEHQDVCDYALSRAIPEHHLNKLYAVNHIQDFTRHLDKYKDKELPLRNCLAIPFITEGKLTHVQFRTIEQVSFRYLTIEVDESSPKVFGMNLMDDTSKVYVLEGPIDALMVRNGIATAGATNKHVIQYLRNTLGKDRLVFVFDNDYMHNEQVMKQLRSRIQNGYSVVIYDRHHKAKDANDMITKYGWSHDELLHYYQTHTYKGAAALTKLLV